MLPPYQSGYDALRSSSENQRTKRAMSPDDIYQLLERRLRVRRAELIRALNPDRIELQLVDAAIARFESGDYGVCCGCLAPVELQTS